MEQTFQQPESAERTWGKKKGGFAVTWASVQKENLIYILIKGSLDEKLPIYEQDPKSKRLDSFEKRFVRD